MQKVDRFTQGNYFALVFILVSSLKLLYTPLVTGDVYIWLASGLKMIRTHALDNVDSFSIHLNTFIIYPSHLSSILYALLFKIGGSTLLFFSCRILGVLLLIVLYKKYLAHAPKNSFNLFVGIFSAVGAFYMLDRPAAMVSLLVIFVLDHLMFLKSKNKTSDYLIYYLLVVLWTNLHPSSLVIFPLLFIQFCFIRNIQQVKYTILTILAVITNPIGYKIFSYAFMTMNISKTRFVGEWGSVFVFHDHYFSVLFSGLLICLWLQIYRRRMIKKYLSSGLIIFALLALSNARHATLFCLTILPTFYFLELWEKEENIMTNPFHQKIILGTLMILSVWLIGNNYYYNHFNDEDIQMDIVHCLETKRDLRIFNNSDGGFLSVYLNDSNKIFFDNRNIIFNNEIFHDYRTLFFGRELQAITQKYQFNTIIASLTNLKLISEIEKDSSWTLAFSGHQSLVFFRR